MRRILRLVFAFALLVAWTTPARAAIAVVTSVQAGSSDGNGFTSGSADTTGANLVACLVSSYEGTGAPTFSDSKSNTWVGRTVYALTGEARLQFFYATGPPTVGSGHTFTVTGASSFAAVACIAFSGAHATAPYDQESGATASAATTLQAGSVTPSEANEVVVVGHGQNSFYISAALNGGFTVQETLDGSGTHVGVSLGYLIQTSAAAANPTWTPASGAARNQTANTATFKVAAAGGSQTGTKSLLGAGK